VSFTNISVRTSDTDAVAGAVKRLPRHMNALVAPAERGWVTVFEESMDEPDDDRLSGYVVMLSDRLKTAAVGFLVFESDVLMYTAAENGRLADQYSSWPDYFDENLPDEDHERLAGNPKVLAQLAGVAELPVRRAMEAEHDFAEEKLAALARALGLPPVVAQWGYNDLTDESLEEGPANRTAFITIPYHAISVLPSE
jgi:hypothetical protein